MPKDYIFTSESVSEGHPDKLCDQISDSVLDAYLKLDPNARVACECFATTNKVVVGGEVRTTNGKLLSKDDIDALVRNLVKEIGYEQEGFSWKTLDMEYLLHSQSANLAATVGDGAGDQGIMFGYAVRENEQYMPSTIYYSHLILRNIMEAVRKGEIKDIGPDGKSQVTIKYVDGKPVAATKIQLSLMHKPNLNNVAIKKIVLPILERSLPKGWLPPLDDIFVNPNGEFIIGGPDGDTGLTGRKIIVDTYGGAAPHGGGAFSGKDATKVDRSGAYALRYLAKNVVAAGLADKCLLQVGYAIGVADPLSLYIDTAGTAKVDEDKILKTLQEVFSLRPRAIREKLGLTNPIFKRTATYGHFGRTPEADGGFSWEKVDLVDELKSRLKA